MTAYRFQRGESVSLALEVASGDAAIVSGVTARLKAAGAGRGTVDAETPVAATFDVSFVAAAGAEPARWLLGLSPTVCATLIPGNYLADARLSVGGGVAITETVALTIREAVTSS